ncbi:AAA family ATPase [Porcipelethomonas sp.]|uniref:cytidylate kinase-like family protein n=1 Tax=Porcipelethomonas sp. TaxID=2981675 RepID=UPI003EF9B64C
MKYNYVVIEREFASGGQEIGMLTAKKLNIPCYGREILEKAAKRENVSVEYLEELEENTSGSFLYSLYKMSGITNGSMGSATAAEKLNADEIDIIRKFASEGPAVFVGRSAAFAIKDRKDVLKVFVHSDMESRIKRACEVYGFDNSEVRSILKKCDKRRSNYYKMNFGNDWKEMTNYDLIINSSALGTEKASDIITECCR